MNNTNIAVMKGDTALPKSQFTEQELMQLREALTFLSEGYVGDTINEFKDFREDKSFFYVPNRFFRKRYKRNFSDLKLIDSRYDYIMTDTKVTSNIELRDNQKKIMANVFHNMKNNESSFIVKANVGIGKSVMMLYLAFRSKRKTLILVHRSSLMKQFIKSIEETEMLSNVRLGTIKGSKIDIDNKDIVIGMIETAMSEKNQKYLQDFGLILIDEVERIASPVFVKAIKMCPAKYKIGWSATPYRFDGGKELLKNNIGDILVDSEALGIEGSPVNPSIICIAHNFEIYPRGGEGKKATSYFEDTVNSNIDRYDMLLSIVKHIANNPKRKILVMVSRRQAVTTLTNYFRHESYKVMGLMGGATEAQMEIAKSDKTQIVIANKQYISVGVSIDDLNTLIFFDFVQGGVVQKIGRITRRKDGIERLVIDIVDNTSKLSTKAFNSKLRHYRYKIKTNGVYYHKWSDIANKVRNTNYKEGDFLEDKKTI